MRTHIVTGHPVAMSLALDHVLVCTAVGAPEAAALVAGLVEGSGNEHPGQGTACRRFFFHDAYLELLWVHDEAEARGARTAPLRLWERWRDRADGRTAPFGIALRSADASPLPFETWRYRPAYLPEPLAIEVATNGDHLDEPMLFHLPFAWRPDAAVAGARQPLAHPLGLRELTRVALTLAPAAAAAPSAPLAAVVAAGIVELVEDDAGPTPLVVLGFDGERSGAALDLRPALPLVLRW